jgi:predicted transcriptional regulator
MNKSRPGGKPELTPAQMEIMEVIWSAGEAGVAEVWKALASRREVARNTVQTMLTRLHERGWLIAREEGNAFVYRAARPRRPVVNTMADRLLDRVFGGSLSGLVAAIVESRSLPAEEVARLRAIIDGAAEGGGQEDPSGRVAGAGRSRAGRAHGPGKRRAR